VRIRELMAKNQTGVADEVCEFEDWIEIHNGSTQSVDLSGWFLSALLDDGLQTLDSLTFGLQSIDRSHGRMPSTGEHYFCLMDPSPGSQNEPVPGEAVRFSAVGGPITGPTLSVTGLPFSGQIVQLSAQGLAPGTTGLLKVGRALSGGADLVDERLYGVEQIFQTGGLGVVNLSAVLPRWSSRLQPSSAVPADSVFYLRAEGRSGETNAVAVGIQN